MPRTLISSIALALLLSLALSCRKGDIVRDGYPDTFISFESINLSGSSRLNSEVRLSWYGTVQDGHIIGFEISLDNQNWNFTTSQDSSFIFDIPPGQDSTDITFYVRAIDNYDRVDPSPALLIVPLKNSPPSASFLNNRGPGDTAFIAASFFWTASDPDGNNTIKEVQLKLNQGDWKTVDRSQSLISIIAEANSGQSGTATAELYYGTSTAASALRLEGLRLNDTNRIFIRAIDIADAVSRVDTSPVFYYRTKSITANVLWLSGHSESITAQYRQLLNAAGIQFDLFDLGKNQGAKIPNFIDPTLHLIFAQYNQAFLNMPSTSMAGSDNTLLEALAPVVQRFADADKRYFITTSFTTGSEISLLSQVYPVSDKVVSTVAGSQARIVTDSSLVALVSGNYPDLAPNNVEFGVVPMLPSADAQAFYRAELTRFRGWNGSSDVVASVRRRNGKITEVFFAQELHRFQRNVGSVDQLIDQIFNNEF